MVDKNKAIEEISADLLVRLQSVISSNPADITAAMRHFMDAKELQMFDLALYCEGEMIRAEGASAHLAACLMGASMNEALLTLLCLRYESEVKLTKQYGYSTRKKPRAFRDVIGDWKFEQLITVAEEKEWIPADIVDEAFKLALAEGFRELMPVTHPEMSEAEVERGAGSFFAYPGTAMLRMTQDLRNAIHAGRWMRAKHPFVAEHFSEWCHFATHLSGEIRNCLLHLVVQRDSAIADAQLMRLTKLLEEFPPEFKSVFLEQVRAKLNS